MYSSSGYMCSSEAKHTPFLPAQHEKHKEKLLKWYNEIQSPSTTHLTKITIPLIFSLTEKYVISLTCHVDIKSIAISQVG